MILKLHQTTTWVHKTLIKPCLQAKSGFIFCVDSTGSGLDTIIILI